ncbi:hypothetical protein AAVH_06337 [Aphelenchoides avenae]|nr:hypothetical protein AAVH_06337 [Aphelenchus avenae]
MDQQNTPDRTSNNGTGPHHCAGHAHCPPIGPHMLLKAVGMFERHHMPELGLPNANEHCLPAERLMSQLDLLFWKVENMEYMTGVAGHKDKPHWTL